MALYGGLDASKHFDEFDDPIETQEGVLSSATRKARALANLGVTATAAELNAMDGITSSVAELNILTGVTADAAELNITDGLLATTAELNRVADVSTRIVSLAVSTAITEVDHEGKTIVMSGAGAARTFTLPAATGGGARYRFVVGEVNTSGYLIKSVVGTDLMKGVIMGDDGGALTTPLVWAAGATDDTITLNGTTTGGVSIGDWVELEDISATAWAVRGVVQQSGAEATPFSDTVA